MLCATSVPPSAHRRGPASPTCSHLRSELAVRKTFWAFWLIFACYPPQHWIGWFATRKPSCLPAPRWGVSLSTYPSATEACPGCCFFSRKRELHVWERKGNRRKDEVAGRNHCWLLQRKDSISESIKNFVKLNKKVFSCSFLYKHKSSYFLKQQALCLDLEKV